MSNFSIQIPRQLLWRHDMFKDINLVPDELNDTITEGRCVGFILKIAKSCIVCNNTLYDENTKNNKITCTSCSTTMLSSECPSKHVCTLTMKLADGTHVNFRPTHVLIMHYKVFLHLLRRALVWTISQKTN